MPSASRPPLSRCVRSLLLRADCDDEPESDFNSAESLFFALVDALFRPHLRILYLFAYTSDSSLPQSSSASFPFLSSDSLDPPLPHLVDLHLSSLFAMQHAAKRSFASLRSLRTQTVPPDLPNILARVFPNLADLTIDALVSGPASINLVHYLGVYCSPEDHQPSKLRSVTVHLIQGHSTVPVAYINGKWRDIMLEDVMWYRSDLERVRVAWDCDSEDDDGAFKIEVEGRALTVYPPIPLAEEKKTMEWEANKRLWVDAIDRCEL
ncbi:hypothetical protein EIP91_001704 [Steccherinum ochraceum]|uniref:Uncharacterized protein n=1 Tax=Steccherinum ochraceum TaxID=92696 RepID=A0A4R0RDE9_9APHY|nr:hypothetical protein EIP91_001704 [Steccherinum ochraceum]